MGEVKKKKINELPGSRPAGWLCRTCVRVHRFHQTLKSNIFSTKFKYIAFGLAKQVVEGRKGCVFPQCNAALYTSQRDFARVMHESLDNL